MGCVNVILDIIFIKFLVWYFKFCWTSIKYMGMWLLAVFIGPGKTILKHAISNTERKTGVPYTETPELFKLEKAKVTAWMVWAGFMWLVPIVGGLSTWLAQ